MNSFLKQTAESIVRKIGWNNLNSATLVLPTHRAGLTLKDEILRMQQAESQNAIYAPHITTISQLFDDLSPLYAEDELMTIVRLYRLYLKAQNATETMPLDMFYGWGKQMLADFTNVDASMHAEEVPNFFKNAVAANKLDELDIDAELRARLEQLFGEKGKYDDVPDTIRKQYEKIWQSIDQLYQSLHIELAGEQKGYAGMRQRSVIEQWGCDCVQEKIKDRMFVFVGFNYLLPVEFELMKHLLDAKQALFYWDYVADFQTNEKAFSFAVQNSERLASASQPQHWTEPKKIQVYSCSSREAQAQYVHQWLLDNYTEEGQRVGVVICDESMLEPVIYALPSITLPGKDEPTLINITKGFPLRNTQLFADVLRWLNNRDNGKADDIVSPEFIDKLSAYLFPEKDHSVSQDEPQVQKGMEWQELLKLESNYQVRHIINQMRKIIIDGLGDIPMTLKLVRLLMRRMMESVTMPFHGEPISDIQVLGVLETRMLDFDKLLLLNVEEGVVPQSQADLSFIPYYLRKYYHMQTNDERATVYAYNFFRLLSRAGETTVLFGNISGSDGSKGMSRFVMQMLTSPQEFAIDRYRLNEHSTIAERTRFDVDMALVEKYRRRIFSKEAPLPLSPSALNTYIKCPWEFYLDKIKGVQEPEEEEQQLAVNTFGTLVHGTMQAIYQQMGCDDSKPIEIDAAKLAEYKDEAKLDEMLAKAYQMLNESQANYQKTKTYAMEKYYMDNPKVKQYVLNLIDNDLRTIESEGLKIWKLEQSYYIDLDIPDKGVVKIGGQIDRVDICGYKTGQERIRIVDYKTGGYSSVKMSAKSDELMENADKGYVRQTVIYCHILQENLKGTKEAELPIQPNLFFCSKDMTGQNSVISVDSAVNDYKVIMEKVVPKLTNKIGELLDDTRFPQCEEGKCPSYCPFFGICERKKPEF